MGLGVPGLDESALHLLRGFAGGQVRQQLRIIELAELDPSGRAGGDQRQYSAVLHSVDKLMGFLHNGHVGAEISVEYLIKAQAAQSGNHFALYVGADGHTEFLAQSGADRRSGLNHNMLLGIGDSGDHLVDLILFTQSAGGAVYDALAAGYAGHVAQILFKGAADMGIEAAAVGADHAHELILAGGHAAAAEDTLIIVANHMQGGLVQRRLGILALKGVDVLHAVVTAQLLQLAVFASHTGEALLIMGGEHQLQGHLSGLHDSGGVGVDLHALVNRINAGGNQGLCPDNLDHTDTAGADLV